MTTYQPCEELRTYLLSDSALSPEQLRILSGVKSAQQILHWRDGVRRPNPEHAVALEKATKGAVPRYVWYPNWRKIWPEYRPKKSVRRDEPTREQA